MSIFESITAHLSGKRNAPQVQYFFALNISPEKLTAGLWSVDGDKFRVVNTASSEYSRADEIVQTTDQLLDRVLGDMVIEPSKILFGVQDLWLVDDDLKEPYLKILKQLVKELELMPMAYVATSHALVHFLEKQDGSPITSILTGIGKRFVTVTSVRAGRIDGSVSAERGANLGASIEKCIDSVAKSDVLPAKILIYGEGNLEKQKSEVLSYPWMSKLSFLHFPKIEILQDNLEITAIALAGAVEVNPKVKIDKNSEIDDRSQKRQSLLAEEPDVPKEKNIDEPALGTNAKPKIDVAKLADELESEDPKQSSASVSGEEMGFVAGDVTELQVKKEKQDREESEIENEEVERTHAFTNDEALEQELLPVDDFGPPVEENVSKRNVPAATETAFTTKESIVKKIKLPRLPGVKIWSGIVALIAVLIGIYVLVPKAVVHIYVEPRILEKETQIIADPSIKEIDKEGKSIPGEIIETQVSGSGKGVATGKKQIGDPSRGVVNIYNQTDSSKTFAKGTTLVGSAGVKFTLDTTVIIASRSAIEGGISFGKSKSEVTAVNIGPDGNVPSGTEFTISGFTSSQFNAKSEGNFSGGTSKDVTVVTSDDQKKLLADVASDLRKKAKDELQIKLNSKGDVNAGKKVLEETLTDEISKKVYSKNVNDQASEFNLDLTIKFKGTAFNETDLRTTIAKLVGTNIPEDFMLNLSEAETQADVSKVEKDGKVTFKAKLRAKLIPRVDTDKIRKQIIGKTPNQAADIMKMYENVLGSDIEITPKMPEFLQRLPILEKNIKVDVGLK